MTSRPDPVEVGNRLQLLRIALGHRKQVDMVRFLGAPITTQHWNNWEKHRNAPTNGQARHIAMKARVTVDWIYWGDRAGLPLHMAQTLDEAERRGFPTHA